MNARGPAILDHLSSLADTTRSRILLLLERHELTVGELKPEKVAAAGPEQADHGRLGLAVRALTDEEKKEAELANGLVVEQASGPAAQAGIRQGDVILAVNGKPVKSAADLRAATSKGKVVALLIQREDAKIFVPVEIG